MGGLVEEIQALALDPTVKVADLLRRVKLAASKLGLGATVAWVDAELTGYKAVESVPEYRTLIGRVMVHSPYLGVYPLRGDSKIIGMLSRVSLIQPISSLEEMAQGKDGLMVPVSRDVVNMIEEWSGGGECDINKHITQASVFGIIDQVRSSVLDWACALEDQGILGEGISFSVEEKKKAEQAAQSVTINNYGHMHQGDVNGSQNRTVVGSVDNSVNSLEINDTFDQVILAVNSSVANENDRREIVDLVEAMRDAQGTPEYKPLFQKWVGYLAEYATVLSPFVPALSGLIA